MTATARLTALATTVILAGTGLVGIAPAAFADSGQVSLSPVTTVSPTQHPGVKKVCTGTGETRTCTYRRAHAPR